MPARKAAKKSAKSSVKRPRPTKKAVKASVNRIVKNAKAAPSSGPKQAPMSKTDVKITRNPAKNGKPATVSLRLSRVFKAPPERLWHCFTDADAYAKWIPPHGFTGHVHHMEPKVGGSYRMSFNTLGRTWGHSFGGKFVEMTPYTRIVHTDKFESDDPVMGNAEMLVTITFTPVPGGTRLDVVQEGIPDGPAADGSPIGWGQSLDNLQRLVEADLPF